MMAGVATKANTAIGAVTEAQMAKIFFSEYCLELAGASSCAGSVCVFVMSLSVAGWARLAHRPQVWRLPPVVRRADDAYVLLKDDVWRASACAGLPDYGW
jgi:hypothetical protein